MNGKTWIPLVIAGVLALVAGKVGMDLIGRKKGPAVAQVQTVKTVVTSKDIPQGSALRATDLALIQAPNGGPAGTFATIAELDGRVVTVALVKGQTVLENLLAPEGTPQGIMALVPPGMRAITIEVNEFSGVAGWLQPQARVDIVATIKAKENDHTAARVVAENLKILAVNKRFSAQQEVDPNAPGIRSVTLLATPHEVEVIELTAHMGNPRLVLRGPHDTEIGSTGIVTVSEMRGESGIDAQATAPASAPTTNTSAQTPSPRMQTIQVEIIKGGGRPTTQYITVPSTPVSPVTGSGGKIADRTND